ncbi:MAG: glutathione S-transferase N-terminal domain-containing protein [Rhodobacteraceae bacterium]|nr:glutathione S-transferase N-terminal domain-containing protein [Paracoccaceae bacterium]
MTDLSAFPITQRWPAENPDVIQLYSFPTPNGVKVSIALEELGLPYEAHKVSIMGDVNTPEFLSLNPNNKIPAIIDPNGPDGAPLELFESGAILIYLADKTGKLIGSGAKRYETIQWVMFQMGGLGPMFGQLGFFYKFKGSEIEDPRPRERYINEAKRLLNVMETQLSDGREWITGEFSIADIAIAPWIGALEFYGAREVVGWSDFPKTNAYLDRFMARPAVQKGRNIPPRD